MTISDIVTTIKLMESIQDSCDDLSHFIVESSKNRSLINGVSEINDSISSMVKVMDGIIGNLSPEELDELDSELEEQEDLYYEDEEE